MMKLYQRYLIFLFLFLVGVVVMGSRNVVYGQDNLGSDCSPAWSQRSCMEEATGQWYDCLCVPYGFTEEEVYSKDLCNFDCVWMFFVSACASGSRSCEYAPCCEDLECESNLCAPASSEDSEDFEGFNEKPDIIGEDLTFGDIILVVYRIVLLISIVIGIFLIIINGYTIMTSQGDPRKVQEGREGLTSAIIGLLFVLLAVSILRVILTSVLNLSG